MQDNDSNNMNEANAVIRLIKKLAGYQTVVPASEQRVMRRDPRPRTIVEVTEELLRQQGK
ncbi:hypothetical protein [Herbaspirillum sp. ST 5-3]|uniref:hypothetical protein n=1 Tax=Oxalobacteraceae TaxID=75682 RepID=UPI0010A58A03|nr:hypothetical protein [Herbaspirillum sp. ST 5-3]